MHWLSTFYYSLNPSEVFLFWCAVWGGIISIVTVALLLAPTIKGLEFLNDDDDDDENFPWNAF